jgi:hypothetical protein
LRLTPKVRHGDVTPSDLPRDREHRHGQGRRDSTIGGHACEKATDQTCREPNQNADQ